MFVFFVIPIPFLYSFLCSFDFTPFSFPKLLSLLICFHYPFLFKISCFSIKILLPYFIWMDLSWREGKHIAFCFIHKSPPGRGAGNTQWQNMCLSILAHRGNLLYLLRPPCNVFEFTDILSVNNAAFYDR